MCTMMIGDNEINWHISYRIFQVKLTLKVVITQLRAQRMNDEFRAKDPLEWRHNGRNGVSNHQPHHCLLNRLFMCRSKKTSKLRVTGLCVGNSPVTGEFSAQGFYVACVWQKCWCTGTNQWANHNKLTENLRVIIGGNVVVVMLEMCSVSW